MTIASTSLLGGTGSTAATAATAAGSRSSTSASDAADRFMTLLITQMRNQDPLNPLDNAQITSQLAQINTVSGINKLNDSVGALSASIGASQSLQAVALVGHSAMVPGDKLELAGGKGTGGFSLPSAAEGVTVTIKDASGTVVRTMTLGAMKPGVSTFAWDGKTDAGGSAKEGVYSFSVAGVAAGKPVTADTLIQGKVLGLASGPNGLQLNLGQVGRFDLSQVVEIN